MNDKALFRAKHLSVSDIADIAARVENLMGIEVPEDWADPVAHQEFAGLVEDAVLSRQRAAVLTLPNGMVLYGTDEAVAVVQSMLYPAPLEGDALRKLMWRLEECGFKVDTRGIFSGTLQQIRLLLRAEEGIAHE